MTEDQIERKVERFMDHLDLLLLTGTMSQRDYDGAVKDLDRWAEDKRRRLADDCEDDEDLMFGR